MNKVNGKIMGFLVLLSACADRDQAELPTYLIVEDYEFHVTAGQGSATQLFSELWIYADSQLLGIFPGNSPIPVLGSDEITLDIFPGMRENGQASLPRIYPMVNVWKSSFTGNPGSTVHVRPVFTYSSSASFRLVEDFESSHLFRQDLDGDTLTSLTISAERSIEGKSGLGWVSKDAPVLEVASNFPVSNIPGVGVPVFLEMEYQSETTLAVGLLSERGEKIYKVILFPQSDTAQKIYLNFTAEVQNARSNTFQIIFRSDYDPSRAGIKQSVLLDNIKLLHFRQ